MDFQLASCDCLGLLAAFPLYCAADLARLERFITPICRLSLARRGFLITAFVYGTLKRGESRKPLGPPMRPWN